VGPGEAIEGQSATAYRAHVDLDTAQRLPDVLTARQAQSMVSGGVHALDIDVLIATAEGRVRRIGWHVQFVNPKPPHETATQRLRITFTKLSPTPQPTTLPAASDRIDQ
jgi:hypothetical protein